MSALIRVPFRSHFDFRALPSIRVMESFDLGDSIYAGVQNGIWPYDEYYWSERKGSWGGVLPMPARESVGNLHLSGATRETFGPFGEPLDRLASGVPLQALGEILYRYNFYDQGVPEGATEHRLYSCTSGELVASAGFGGALGVVPDGSYLLWARTFAGEPFQTGHGLARTKDGEWSALRVIVGSGDWSVSPGICPNPGAALYKKTGSSSEAIVTQANEVNYFVTFDPLARCVSASCVLELPILSKSGAVLVPAGARLIGGLRSSESGPQTALWWLKADGSSQLLGLQTDFTDGVCECAKTNHFASDVVQSPNGDLFVLTECALFRFDPGAASVYEALQGYPAQSKPEPGHPGGNCLRFPKGEMIHWTENFGGVNDGTAHYNRMVRRVAGRDVSGPSTLWHGTNCAETYLGRFWGIRANDTQTLYLDWLDNGRWHGYSGMSREMAGTFWQRLRAVGSTLFLFGFSPGSSVGTTTDAHTDGTPLIDDEGNVLPADEGAQDGAHASGDLPVCAIADGLTLRDAAFPFFIRRATVMEYALLLVAARGASESIGPANRVVEIVTTNESGDPTGGNTHICSFWNEPDHAFEMGRTNFEDIGGNVAKLPAYFVWHPMSGVNAGGKWKATQVAPVIGFYLETQSDAAIIRFIAHPNGNLPYSALQWDRLCFDILSDGSVDTDTDPIIEPTCPNAQCALDSLPEGTRFRVIERPIHTATDPATAIQITDASDGTRLSVERDLYPTLWLRIDSDAPSNDLTTYTHLESYGRLSLLSHAAHTRVEVVVLVTPSNHPLQAHELPILSRRA